MMLLKCCNQYASIIGKLNSGQSIRKDLFSIQSPKKDNAKNVQTTVKLLEFHMLGGLCSKSFKLGFNSMWTKNFLMYKLDLENAE